MISSGSARIAFDLNAGPRAAGDQRLRRLNRDGRVAAVRIGADRLRELLVERRAADEHDVLVAQTLLLERVDDDLHVGIVVVSADIRDIGLVFPRARECSRPGC